MKSKVWLGIIPLALILSYCFTADYDPSYQPPQKKQEQSKEVEALIEDCEHLGRWTTLAAMHGSPEKYATFAKTHTISVNRKKAELKDNYDVDAICQKGLNAGDMDAKDLVRRGVVNW